MDIISKIREAGIVGEGGAGFPTHVKVNCKAECVIANGAECEPLLRVDQQIMQYFPDRVVDGVVKLMEQTGAPRGVIALKDHYHDAIAALNKVIADKPGVELHIMKSTYPAGDEQQIVYSVMKRVVPTGGLPLDVGAVVSNVSTLADISRAMEDQPVTEKYVTVTGAVYTSERMSELQSCCTAQILSRLGLDADGTVTDCLVELYSQPWQTPNDDWPWERSYLGSVLPVDADTDMDGFAAQYLADPDARVLLFVACRAGELSAGRWTPAVLAGWNKVEIQLFGIPADEPLPSPEGFPGDQLSSFTGRYMTLHDDVITYHDGT